MKRFNTETALIILSGISLGGLGAALALWGNPANSGICISCFLENFAGSLALHDNPRMAYFRPELAAFVGGALLMALAGREFRPRTGKLPIMGFVLGFLMIAGSSVFMGCPIKMMLRIGAGDFTAVAGLLGLAAGVFTGAKYLRAGVDMGHAEKSAVRFQGLILPIGLVGLFALGLLVPGLLRSSATGAGAQRAPVLLALGAGLVIGVLAQRSRFCVTGSLTNWFLARDTGLMKGLLALLVSVLLVNLAFGGFSPGMMDQPGSNPDHLWNFLAMALVGFAAVLAGGCPFRQLILASEGLVDAAVVTLGMIAAGALVQQWGIASTSAGPTQVGKVTVLGGFLFCLGVVRFYRVD
jgi:YedE family putative selenium metabolism protein